MKKIILSADDMGLSPGVNKGIIDAYKNGLVTHASVLATADYVEDAVKLCKANPGLEVSAHLDLSLCKPLLDSSWTLTDDEGMFLWSSGINHTKIFTEKQYVAVNLELRAQIDKLINLGLKPVALTSHSGFARNLNLFKIITTICNDYKLIIRDEKLVYKNFSEELRYGYMLSCDKIHNLDITLENFDKLITPLFKMDDVINVPFLPGFSDDELVAASPYNTHREERDLPFLKSKELRQYLKDNNIVTTTYKKR